MRVDMSPGAVGQRLREVSRLGGLPPQLCPPRVDMSPAGVGRRLREVAELHALERRLRLFAPHRSAARGDGGSPTSLDENRLSSPAKEATDGQGPREG